MVAKIIWSPRAVFNLEDICNYIARDSLFYASLFAKKIVAIVRNIPDFPMSGRVVPEFNEETLREKIYENYRIVYRIRKEAIEIVAISHGSMRLDNIL